MKALVLSLALASGATAHAQASPEDHTAHHPGQGASAPGAPVDRFEQQLKQMQDMHQRMLAAKTQREREALMGEHMKLMQSGLAMMEQMRAGRPGTGMGMMGMHAPMEQRMAMMEAMMQMMVDRESAVKR